MTPDAQPRCILADCGGPIERRERSRSGWGHVEPALDGTHLAQPPVTPWNNEPAMPAPTHINGLVVVAAIKVPTRGSGELTHQWYVTCEDRDGKYTVWHSAWSRSAYIASHGDYDLDYTAAVEVMLQRAGYLTAKG